MKRLGSLLPGTPTKTPSLSTENDGGCCCPVANVLQGTRHQLVKKKSTYLYFFWRH